MQVHSWQFWRNPYTFNNYAVIKKSLQNMVQWRASSISKFRSRNNHGNGFCCSKFWIHSLKAQQNLSDWPRWIIRFAVCDCDIMLCNRKVWWKQGTNEKSTCSCIQDFLSSKPAAAVVVITFERNANAFGSWLFPFFGYHFLSWNPHSFELLKFLN